MNAATPAPIPLREAASVTPDPSRTPDRAPGTDDRAVIAPSKLPPWRRDAQLAAVAASASASANTGDARRDGPAPARILNNPLKQFLLKKQPRLVGDGPSPTNSPDGSPVGSPEPRLNGNGSGVAVAPAAEDQDVSPGPRGETTAHLLPVPDAVVAPAAVDDRIRDVDEDVDDFDTPVGRTSASSNAAAADPATCTSAPPRRRVPSLTSPTLHATAHLSPVSPLSSLSPTTPVSPPPTSAAAAAPMSPPAPLASASPAPSRARQQLYFQRTTTSRSGVGKYMPAHCLVCDLCVSETTTPGACQAHAQGQSCELAQDRANALVSAGAAINLTALTPSCRAFLETSRYWSDIVRHATRMATTAGTDAAFSVTLCRKRCYSQWTRRKALDGVPIKRRPRKKPAVERDSDGDAAEYDDDDADGECAPDPMPPRKRPRRSTRPNWVAPSPSLPQPSPPPEPVRRSTLPPPPARARPINPAPLMARARKRPPPPPPPVARARPSGSTARALERAVDHEDDMDVDVEATTPKRIDPPAAVPTMFAPRAAPQDPLFALIAGQMYVARTMMQVETMRARLALRERLHAMGYSKEEVEREVAGLVAAGQAAPGGVGMMGGIGMGMMGVDALPGTGELGAGVPRKL
ncbi:hypothetical protein AMAG_15392 [Allomyces macrogynus ATCC 38327]|uniref:Uncharacterized protein n=1 Tax=Allomyces macrogynus (strain ATCC 38327) TaxID=578462 RepID=A0A0L0T7G3_ALLM3|nr:hypothetical protein AMAG_15392 [Allomyces macrogynus ATCC 38327]|eukprot:KNE70636.1 hypothetical protein AMAG_15392 [Allomyces macrogynus ATCC 38327]